MTTLKPYPEYRESGIEWLEEIPSHWEVAPLMSCVVQSLHKNSRSAESNLLSLSYGRIVRKDIGLNDGLLPESFDTYQIVEPNDLVFRLTDLQNDKRSLRSALVDERGIITSAYLAVTPRSINPGYLAYLMRDVDNRKVFYAMGGGLRQSMKFADMKRLPILYPPVDEQQSIVAFLDREAAEIDAFIADQEELIGLLTERRAATISHAVTKGLDPSVPMKDSGVEWWGEIPEHSMVKRIKEFVSVSVTDGPHETPTLHDSGVPFVSAEAVGSGSLDLSRARGFISEEDDVKFAKKYRPRRDDIYMVKSGATTGVVAIVDTDTRFNIWSPLAAIRCGSLAHPKFVMYAMKSTQFRESVELHWSFGTQQNIGMRVIENLSVPFPSIGQQRLIADYLDRETAELDAAIADAREAIALSRERRAALISAAVTGKIDVRGAA